MALAKVRYRDGEEYLDVVGHGKILMTDAGLVANREVLEPAGLTSLRRALERHQYAWGYGSDRVHLTEEPEGEIDDESQLGEIGFVFEDEQLLAQAFVPAFGPRPEDRTIRSLASPALERQRMQIAKVNVYEEKWGWAIWLTLQLPIARRSVRDAIRATELVSDAVQGAYVEEFDRGTAARVIRARHPELLVKSFESVWLEAKSSPYRLTEKDEQYELAKDVAGFANASGGLILIGAKTKRRPEGDQITAVNGCVLSQAIPAAMRSTLRRWVYPRIDDLQIDQIVLSGDDRGVVLIEVPAQEETRKPFLVAGARAGRTSQLGFTYAVREGEGVEAPRIEVVHQLIRVGIAVLSGSGQIPNSD